MFSHFTWKHFLATVLTIGGAVATVAVSLPGKTWALVGTIATGVVYFIKQLIPPGGSSTSGS